MGDGASGPVKVRLAGRGRGGLAEQLYILEQQRPGLCGLLSSACNCSLHLETLRVISQTLFLRR